MGTHKAAGARGAVCVGMVFAAILLAVATVPAGAAGFPAAYPPPVVGLQLSASAVCPGGPLIVTGQGFAAGRAVTITLMSDPVTLGTATTNSAGSFTQTVTIPATTAPGSHLVVATGPSLANPTVTLTLSAHLTVESCPAPAAVVTPPPSSPLTGFASRAWLTASLAFILVGSALVLATRRRRHHRTL